MGRTPAGTFAFMTRIALVVTYLLGLVTAVIVIDTDAGDGWLSTVWVLTSVLLGAGIGDYRFATLSLLLIPIAIPFGLPADTYGDPVLPVWVGAIYIAVFSAALIVLAAAVRRFVESRRRRRTSRGSGIA